MPDQNLKNKSKRAEPRGDVIIAKVGKGARDVIIGKNIIKIGTLQIPALPVLIGLLVILGGGSAAGYYFSLSAKMPADPNFPYFNVIVADFGQVDKDGRIGESAAGSSLSASVFTSLDNEFKALPQDVRDHFRPTVWHSSMFLKQMRYPIGRIATQAEAEKLAQDIGANVVIYGNFKARGDSQSFDPEFYVLPLRNEADEIVGTHDLGAPIDQTSLLLKIELTDRLKLFSKFTLAVMYDLFGQNALALDLFSEMQKSAAAARATRGSEVINFFIGRENLFQAQEKMASADPNAKAQVESFLASAEAAFKTSSDANTLYARAHIGLGGIYLTRAQRQDPLARFNNPEWVNRALQEYQKAYDLALQSNETQTQVKAQVSLGNAYFLQGESFLHHHDWALAAAAFDKTIQSAEPQLPRFEQQYRILGQTYLGLGNAYYEKAIALGQTSDKAQSKATYQKALQWYAECIQLKKIPDTILQSVVVASCEKYQPEVQKALASIQ